MKPIYQFLISSTVVLMGCNPQNKSSENPKVATEVTQKIITFADFKKVKGVDNVQDVPFQLFTKLDSVQFFVNPDKEAAHLKIAYNKLDNYYGFEEFDDFYSIHYSINNNISNSIEAFVLKSEFTASFDLTLKGVNLYEIRSSTWKGSQDFKNKSFSKYGTITEVSEQEFKAASANKINEVLVKNPHIKLKDDNWIYTENGKETMITQHETVSTEEGTLSNEYIGQSPSLHLEIFKENSDETAVSYYTFYNVKSLANFEISTDSYPQILPGKNQISYISSNNDVGSDFVISQYTAWNHNLGTLLYINFTNFKIGDETKAFWKDDKTFYAEVHPTNSAVVQGKKQKSAFIKIQLKTDLLQK
ncbi:MULTISPECIES: resolvase [unclassified Chryseobacterium]|uniref:resolvase n=1 Tax=unclassified Chryseobacterium TaxID=2593645 RepID=UPI00100AF461|nr:MULTISPECIES: resolvase [unclassified Chryseobacterium]RXM51377.1 resolvase [Chryseobacterium sp. CH25]RXM64987.1 resolvase [Chryseobacterium sp. CH1]